MKYVGFVPLRGGSKGIPHKNLTPIAGKPLCQWVLEAASGARFLDEVVVSTDSMEIAEAVVAMGLPKVRTTGRSAASATDTASTEQAMIEYARDHAFENLVLLQATSPLTTAGDIDGAIVQFEQTGADSLVSVVSQTRFIWSVTASGLAQPMNYEPAARPRRQDFPPYYVENGAVYISRRSGLLSTGSRLFGRMSAYAMAEATFLEIDEPSDVPIVEAQLLQRRLRTLDGRDLEARANRIRLLLTDVDGVLTDAGMYYSEAGDELKKFNTRDGKAIELLRNAGLLTGIITSETTALVERRAKKLKFDYVFQGIENKLPTFFEVLRLTGLQPDQVAYIGDDLGDVPVLKAVGLAACPSDAAAAAAGVAHFQCKRRGGEGALRELVDFILAVQSQQVDATQGHSVSSSSYVG